MKPLAERLNKKHNRAEFDCGNESLNNYLKRYANQDVKKGMAVCYVLADDDENVIGYYTISADSLTRTRLHSKYFNKISKYPTIPVILFGRLAIDNSHHGKGIGKVLLFDALLQSLMITEKLGAFAIVVDPIDESAKNFYSKFGFVELEDSQRMFIAMDTIKQLIAVEVR